MRLVLYVICFLLSVQSVFAVDGTFELYPNCSVIYDMLREGDNLWLGTNGGLIRLDVNNGDCRLMERPLLDNVIRHPDLCVGPDGSICALLNVGLTSDTTVGVGSFKDGEWSVMPFQGKYDCFRNILYDRNGMLWAVGGRLGTGPGIFRYDDEWKNLGVADLTGSNDVYSIAEGPEGDLWFAPHGGLLKYDNGYWDWYPFEDRLSIDNITIDRNGTLWGSKRGTVCSFCEGQLTLHPVTGEVTVDDHNCVWCASEKGIMSYTGSSWKLWDDDEIGYPFDIVDGCYSYGNEVWFSAEKDGYPFLLQYSDRAWRKFELPDELVVPPRYPLCVHVGRQDRVWVKGGDLAVRDRSGWRKVEKSEYSIGFPNAIADDRNGTIWFATKRGLVTYDGSSWNRLPGPMAAEGDSSFLDVCIDRDDTLWALMQGRGVARYRGSVWDLYTHENGALPGNRVQDMTIDRQGNIWVACTKKALNPTQGGVCKFDGERWELIEGIDDAEIVAVDTAGMVWIGSDVGVFRFDGISWEQVTANDEDFTHSHMLFADSSGRMWISSIDLYCFENGQWQVFRRNVGELPAHGVQTMAEDKSGNLWMLSSYETACFHPDVQSGVDDRHVPVAMSISPPYPNPFNAGVTLSYEIGCSGIVESVIYSAIGQKVRSFPALEVDVGTYHLVWDGCDDGGRRVASGTYVCRITHGNAQGSVKMMLVR